MSAERVAWGFSLFCEDFRQEIGGKVSLIGINQNEILVSPNFPAIIPKLVIYIKYFEIAEKFKDDLVLTITISNESSDRAMFSKVFKRASFESMAELGLGILDREEIYNMTVPVIFSNFNLEMEGYISVRMLCGDVVTRLGRIFVRRKRMDEDAEQWPPARH